VWLVEIETKRLGVKRNRAGNIFDLVPNAPKAQDERIVLLCCIHGMYLFICTSKKTGIVFDILTVWTFYSFFLRLLLESIINARLAFYNVRTFRVTLYDRTVQLPGCLEQPGSCRIKYNLVEGLGE
jgi:hypothetical protein